MRSGATVSLDWLAWNVPFLHFKARSFGGQRNGPPSPLLSSRRGENLGLAGAIGWDCKDLSAGLEGIPGRPWA